MHIIKEDQILENNPVIKPLSITELSTLIKNTVTNIGFIRVKGEISGFKLATSGHAYLNLKDHNSIIACTYWKYDLQKINFEIRDGLEVIVNGSLTTYGPQSKYQLNIESMESCGIGSLLQMLQERKVRLEQEGLFAQSRKKPLPTIPSVIGVITSLTGAVIQDIIHRIRDRYPSHILIWPVTVQGNSTVQEIEKAIDGFNKLKTLEQDGNAVSIPDVIILARGGGSIEDLFVFNDEIIVRAIARSEIPIISAIGHETDFTLSDFVSDVRAPTPTAAAEIAVPVKKILEHSLHYYYKVLYSKISKQILHSNEMLNLYIKQSFFPAIDERIQELDYLHESLENKVKAFLKFGNEKLANIYIIKPFNVLKMIQISLDNLEIGNSIGYFLAKCENNLIKIDSVLSTINANEILNKGFVILRDLKGNILSSKKQIKDNNVKRLVLSLKDGTIEVEVV